MNNPDILVGIDDAGSPVTKLEIIHFILYRTQRHLIQMRKITAAF
jgi:hypothetical protein